MSYQHLAQYTRLALKRHTCIWCGQHIERGERYDYTAGVYLGDFQSQHWHPECRAVASKEVFEQGEEEFSPWENRRPMDAFDPCI